MPDAQIIPFDGGAARNHGRNRTPDAADAAGNPTDGSAGANRANGAQQEREAPAAKRAAPRKAAPSKAAPSKAAPSKAAPPNTAAKKAAAKKAAKPAAKPPAKAGSAGGAAKNPPKKVVAKKVAPPARRPESVVRPPVAPAGAQQAQRPAEDVWDRRVAGALAFLRRRLTGEYETDEFGFDPEFSTSVLAPALRPVYKKWFRVEISGLEHLADDRGALLVANHSGTIPVDAAMLQLGILDQHPAHRNLRLLAADLVFQMPFVGELARKSGSTLACQPDAERLLREGELVGVFPEGFKGVGKPFSERYKLQRFGRGGFVSAALATGAPIIPCAIVGAEEIYPKLGDAKFLARMFGLPYFPLTPTFPWLGPLGAVPLPSKWYIEIGEPIETSGLAAGPDDPMQVFNLTDQVRETIQQMLFRLLMQRRSVFG
jgi:1-acyl-sn-glycerol-3-phosphate acyltransferase